MKKVCKNVIELPTGMNFKLEGVELGNRNVKTEPKPATTISTKLGEFQIFDELQDFISDYRQRWKPERKFFVDEFTKKLRCVVYYHITNRDFDNFYWYCYNSAKQYLTGFTAYVDEEGIPFNPEIEIRKWISDYKKAYPKLPQESQTLLEEQYNKQVVLYMKYGTSTSVQ